MQANTNCGEILGTIDGARLPGRGLEPVMDRATLMEMLNKSRSSFLTPR